MIEHATLKLIHISCMALSISGFVIRGGLMLAGSERLRHKLTKTLPHYVDSLLLLSGLWMAINLQQYPGTVPWLSAKIIALLIYILLGSLALRGRTRSIRLSAFVLALSVFAYMLGVALTRSAFPWLVL